MKAQYKPNIELSPETISGMKVFMRNFIRDMRRVEPEYPERWYWGMYKFMDAPYGSYIFEYGGHEDMPTLEERTEKNVIFCTIEDDKHDINLLHEILELSDTENMCSSEDMRYALEEIHAKITNHLQ